MIGVLSLVIALSGLSIVLTLNSIAKELSRMNKDAAAAYPIGKLGRLFLDIIRIL